MHGGWVGGPNRGKGEGVLEVTPRTQRRSVIDLETPHGLPDDLTLVKYDAFFIAVNASSDNKYQVDVPTGEDGGRLKDMVSGQMFKSGTSHTLEPYESMVFFAE